MSLLRSITERMTDQGASRVQRCGVGFATIRGAAEPPAIRQSAGQKTLQPPVRAVQKARLVQCANHVSPLASTP
jgi:hypothetical protein